MLGVGVVARAYGRNLGRAGESGHDGPLAVGAHVGVADVKQLRCVSMLQRGSMLRGTEGGGTMRAIGNTNVTTKDEPP